MTLLPFAASQQAAGKSYAPSSTQMLPFAAAKQAAQSAPKVSAPKPIAKPTPIAQQNVQPKQNGITINGLLNGAMNLEQTVVKNLSNLIKPAQNVTKNLPASVKLPSGVKVSIQAPGLKTTTAGQSAQPTITSKSLQQQTEAAQKNPLTILFPQSTQIVKGLDIDPLNLQSNPKEVLTDAWNYALKNFNNQQKQHTKITKSPYTSPSISKNIGNYSENLFQAGNKATTPITTFFNEADKVPILGTFSKLFTLGFVAMGDGFKSATEGIIDSVPSSILSDGDKKNLAAPLGDIISLAAQIVASHGMEKVGASVPPELIKKYGLDDAITIQTKAKQLADTKNAQFEEGKSYDPQEAIGKVLASNADKTPDGKAIIKAATQAQRQGSYIKLSAPEMVKAYQQAKTLKLPAPKENYVSGDGFEMTNKANTQKVEVMKSITDYKYAMDRFNKNPTPRTLKRLQTLRDGMKPLQDKGLVEVSKKASTVEVPKEIAATPEKTIGQMQEEHQSSDLTTYEHAFNSNDTATMDKLAAAHPDDTSFQIHKRLAEDLNKEKPVGKTPSKIATSIERKAIEQGLTKKFDNLAGYDKYTIKDQTEKALKTMSNFDEARQIIRGEKPLPERLRGTFLVSAMEDYLKRNPDAQLSYELANSPLVSATSYAAGELRAAAEREPDSFAARIADLRKNREAQVKTKYGKSVDKAMKDEVNKIQSEVKKKAPTKQDWGSFIQSIQC